MSRPRRAKLEHDDCLRVMGNETNDVLRKLNTCVCNNELPLSANGYDFNAAGEIELPERTALAAHCSHERATHTVEQHQAAAIDEKRITIDF